MDSVVEEKLSGGDDFEKCGLDYAVEMGDVNCED